MQASAGMIASILFRDFVSNSIVVLYYTFFGYVWVHAALERRRIGLCMLIAFTVHVLTRFTLGTSTLTYIATGLMLFTISRILWRPLRGFRFWICFLFCAASEFLLEFLSIAVYLHIYPDSVIVYIGKVQNYTSHPATLPVLFLLLILFYSTPLLVSKYFLDQRNRKTAKGSSRKYLLRLIALIALVVVLMVLFAHNYDNLMHSERPHEAVETTVRNNIPFFLVNFIALALLLFYCWQNIQQYLLYLNNQSLQDKNDAYQRVLDGTREFRHNISNMLYGFEGVIMSEDIGAIKNYYNEMAKRCLLTNNENADALNHIKNPALTALLLRKLDLAAGQEIPFYLNADPNFDFNGLPSARLVEILGVLIDNAVEAAAKAHAPRVNVTLASAPGYDEILISNTYAEGADLSFLAGDAVSSKPGHRATGLASVRKALQRYPDVCFNQYPQGRYIETSLCDYKMSGR